MLRAHAIDTSSAKFQVMSRTGRRDLVCSWTSQVYSFLIAQKWVPKWEEDVKAPHETSWMSPSAAPGCTLPSVETRRRSSVHLEPVVSVIREATRSLVPINWQVQPSTAAAGFIPIRTPPDFFAWLHGTSFRRCSLNYLMEDRASNNLEK